MRFKFFLKYLQIVLYKKQSVKNKNLLKGFILFNILFLFASCKNNDNNHQKNMPKTGNPEIDVLTEAIFKKPNDAQLYFRRAQLFYKNGVQGGYDFAIEDMRYALSLDSTNLGFHHFLADVYLEYAQSRLALETLQRATTLYPDSLNTLLKLGQVQFITKQYSQTLATVDQILQRDPQHSDAFFLLGMNLREMGQTDRAIVAFQKAADFNAKNLGAFLELANLYEAKKDPKALRYIETALLIDSLHAPALISKGVYWQKRGKFSMAKAAYQTLIRHNPRATDAYFNLGLLYLDADSVRLAREHFNFVINEKPTYTKAYYYLGQCEEKIGDKKAAISYYRQATALNPSYEAANKALEKLGE
jgi:tetratricopeptide (TPR) repeat protein